MRYLYHDSGEAVTLKNGQVLGDENPLEFDDEGRAGPLEDDLAEMVAAMDAHVELGERARGGSDGESDDDEESEDDFDADTFVDRTPMEDVIDDLETGAYDDHLDAIEAEASREGVLDAIEQRRE